MVKACRATIFHITALVVMIALADLVLLFLGGSANIARIAPKNPSLVLALYGLIIALGIAIQVWLRNRPKYKAAKLLAYAFTLAVSLGAALVVINLALLANHSR